MRYDQCLITIRLACSISADLYDNYLYLYVLSILSYLSCGDFSRASRCGLGTCNRSCCKECLAGGQVRPVPQLARQAAPFARASPLFIISQFVCFVLIRNPICNSVPTRVQVGGFHITSRLCTTTTRLRHGFDANL